MSFLDELASLGNNPNVRLLSVLDAGSLRFSDMLGDDTAAAEQLLSESLRELDRAGLVARRVDPGPPLRVLYALTPAGARLAPALGALAKWLESNDNGAT